MLDASVFPFQQKSPWRTPKTHHLQRPWCSQWHGLPLDCFCLSIALLLRKKASVCVEWLSLKWCDQSILLYRSKQTNMPRGLGSPHHDLSKKVVAPWLYGSSKVADRTGGTYVLLHGRTLPVGMNSHWGMKGTHWNWFLIHTLTPDEPIVQCLGFLRRRHLACRSVGLVGTCILVLDHCAHSLAVLSNTPCFL